MTCFGKLGVTLIHGSSGAAAAISAPAIGWSGYAGEACTQRIQGGSSSTGGQSDQRRNQRRGLVQGARLTLQQGQVVDGIEHKVVSPV